MKDTWWYISYLPSESTFTLLLLLFSSLVMSNSLPHMDCSTPGLRLPRSPGVCPSSCSLHSDAVQPSHSLMHSSSALNLSQWGKDFFPWGTFPVSGLFVSDGQNTGASASASFLPVNIQDWSPLRLTGLISLLSKGFPGVFSSTTVWRHQFFGILPSLQSSSENLHDHWEDHSLDCMDLCQLSNVSAFQHTV